METATATAAITRPNQRLRIVCSPKAGHEVAHDLLKDGRVQPVADELPFALGGDEVGRLEHAEMVRHRRERDRELLRDLARGEILGGEQLEDLATSRVGQSAKQRIIHGEIFIQVSKYCKVGAQHAAPVPTYVD